MRKPRSLLTLTLLILGNLLGLWPVAPLAAMPSAPPTHAASVDGLEVATGAGRGDGVAAGLVSRPTATPIPFSAVAFDAPTGANVVFRTAWDGAWSPWTTSEALDPDEGPDAHSTEARSAGDQDRVPTELAWVGEADHIQVRVEGGSPQDVRVNLLDTMGHSRSLLGKLADSFRLGVPPAAEAAVKPGIISRAGWGADESIRKGDPSYADKAFFGVVHHTVNANDYTRAEAPAIVRAIYSWHVLHNGWSDIGYNFLVDRFGNVYEGRYGGVDRPVIGAHAGGFNTGSFGISVIGDFRNVSPSRAAVNALKSTIAWKYDVHDINPDADGTVVVNDKTLRTLSGHGDTKSTDCPGRYLYYKLPELRDAVEAALIDWETTGWVPLTGDWDGDGRATAGWFHAGTFYLVNAHTDWPRRVWSFNYGAVGDVPVVGDWDGDGDTNVGVVRGKTWYLRYTNDAGAADLSFPYGALGDRPFAGDWNGDGLDTPGVVRGSFWMLRDRNTSGPADATFGYGWSSDIPVVGDWDANGTTTIGILRDGTWHLRNTNTKGASDVSFNYGRVSKGDSPVTGDWDGNGSATAGIIRDATWYLRQSNSSGRAHLSFNFPPGG